MRVHVLLFFMSKYTHISLTWCTDKLPNLIEYPEFANNGDPAWAIFMEELEVLFCMPDGSCFTFSSISVLSTVLHSQGVYPQAFQWMKYDITNSQRSYQVTCLASTFVSQKRYYRYFVVMQY